MFNGKDHVLTSQEVLRATLDGCLEHATKKNTEGDMFAVRDLLQHALECVEGLCGSYTNDEYSLVNNDFTQELSPLSTFTLSDSLNVDTDFTHEIPPIDLPTIGMTTGDIYSQLAQERGFTLDDRKDR